MLQMGRTCEGLGFRRKGYKRSVTISRRIARPLLASIFIAEGWDAIRNPGGTGKTFESPAQPPTKENLPIQEDTLTLVRLNGIVQVGGGVLLAIGKFPRLASLALIGSIVPTTYAGHQFWEEPDDEIRAQRKIQLLKNLGLLGGLIFSAVDTEGAPSIGWKTRRRVHQVASAISDEHAGSDGHTLQTAARAVDTSRNAGRRANRAATKAARRANATASGVARQATEIATNATTPPRQDSGLLHLTCVKRMRALSTRPKKHWMSPGPTFLRDLNGPESCSKERSMSPLPSSLREWSGPGICSPEYPIIPPLTEHGSARATDAQTVHPRLLHLVPSPREVVISPFPIEGDGHWMAMRTPEEASTSTSDLNHRVE